MRCRHVCVVVANVVAVLFAYSALLFVNKLDVMKKYEAVGDGECLKAKTQATVADFVFLESGWAVGSVDDKMTLVGVGPEGASDGGFLAVTLEPFVVVPLEVVGFPSDVALHPHGLTLGPLGRLYALNYAFNKGGQRIDVFDISEDPKRLIYVKSYSFPDLYMGMFNDFVVAAPNEFYLAAWIPQGMALSSPVMPPLTGLYTFFSWFFNPSTHLLHCKFAADGSVECQSQLYGYMIAGVALIERQVYVTDFMTSELHILNVSQDKNLTLDKTVLSPINGDFLSYDSSSRLLIGAGAFSLYELFKGLILNAIYGDVAVPGGVFQYSIDNKTFVNEFSTRKISGVCSAALNQGSLLIGAWREAALLKC